MARKQPAKSNTEEAVFFDEDVEERDEVEETEEVADVAEPIDEDIVPDIGDELDEELLHDLDADLEGLEEFVNEDLPPVVGGEIDAFCTKCKRLTTHTVVSILRGRPAKVLCNICESQHQYRTAAPEPSREGRVKSAPKTRALWEEALQRAGSQVLPYAMEARFEPEQVIEHATFGKGVVVRTYDITKMEVLFQDQVRRLVHNRKQS